MNEGLGWIAVVLAVGVYLMNKRLKELIAAIKERKTE